MQPRLVYVVTVPQSFVLLRGQARYMREHGLDVSGVSSAGPWISVFESEEGATVEVIEMPRRISPFEDLVAIRQLVRHLRRVRPAIVHAHTPKGGLLGMIAAWIARVPIRLYHIHGLPLETSTGIRRFLLATSERVSGTLAHRVLAVSRSVRDKSVQAGLVRREKVHVPEHGSINGVDATGEFAPQPADADRRRTIRAGWNVPDDAPVVAFIGRIVRDKGVCELTAAWQALRETHPTAHLVLAGPEEERDAVPASVLSSLRNDARVHLLGLVNEPRNVYLASDLIVLPTYREGLPGVPLEAAAMGVPVVITNATGCEEAVADGVSGTVVQIGDVPELTAAIDRYLRSPELRSLHGAQGRRRALDVFAPQRLWAAHLSHYRELLAIHAPTVQVAPPRG